MSAIEWWLLLLILFNSNFPSFGSGKYISTFCAKYVLLSRNRQFHIIFLGEPDKKCILRVDELSSVHPESEAYGPASIDHSYYVALRFDNCGPSDYPSLKAYTIAAVRLSGTDNAPIQLAYFDLQHYSPILKDGSKYRWVFLRLKISVQCLFSNGQPLRRCRIACLLEISLLDMEKKTAFLSIGLPKVLPKLQL